MLRFGIIGCGPVGTRHTKNLLRNPKAKVVGFADVNREAAERLSAEVPGAHVETDARRLCERRDMDAVVVAVPNNAYRQVIPVAAECGKHVFSEKPMGMSSAEARDIVAACRQAGVKLMIGYCLRFYGYLRRAMEIVRSGELGCPVIWREFNTNDGPTRAWYYERARGGGPFIDEVIHRYDLGRAMFGEPVAVQASLLNLRHKGDAFDTGNVVIRFEKGDQFWTQNSWGAVTRPLGVLAPNFMGPKGYLSLHHGGGARRVEPYGQSHLLKLHRGKGEPELIEVEPNDAYYDEVDHFIACVLEGREPVPSGPDAIRALEVAEAVLRAGESRQTVELVSLRS
ncbi:MAG: Gfo/Idh/MocA family oxidoreductase [Planctomycetes bacterium]|nr:Gfo/Idh/MocA family oxidoreductase [Planctomycetota bacterium]